MGGPAMGGDEYRRRARRCLAQARLVTNQGARANLIDLAARWMALAERAERRKPIVQQQQQQQPKRKAPT